MDDNQVRARNYCAHAIDDLRRLQVGLRQTMPQTANVFGRVIEMLQHSVKFILPNCGDLIDPDDLRQSHLDLTRLPFPCVAFEAPFEKDDAGTSLGGFEQTPATKRIALCWEPRPEFELLPGLNAFPATLPEGGTFVLPIYWTPRFGHWIVASGGGFIPYNNTVKKADLQAPMAPASYIAHKALIEAERATATAMGFRCEPFYVLPEMHEQLVALNGGNQERAYAQIIMDARDEVQMVVQACSVINCANVTTADLPPEPASNKKRIKNGNQPFFSYKVLQLSDEARKGSKHGAGGSHASARMHLRRGHLRRLESKVVWVRPAMVNAGSKDGVVVKDYAVTRSTTPQASP